MNSMRDICNVYIHTPSWITAVGFVVSLATMLCTVANKVLRDTRPKEEHRATVKALADIQMNVLVWYDRRKDRMSVPDGTSGIFALAERLRMPPEKLLTF